MATYVYPNAIELMEVERNLLPALTMDDPLFSMGLVGIRNLDKQRVRWTQKDDYIGLQQLRGLGGDPTRVKKVGAKSYDMKPGVYGEFYDLDEEELTLRRRYVDFSQKINIDDMVREGQDYLLNRRINRIRQILWTLMTTGTFSVPLPTGGVGHTDTFNLLTYTASVGWGTSATATPLSNFRAIQLLGRGSSSNFGAGALAFMNRVTFNKLVANTNTNDLAGRRLGGLQTVLNLNEINMVLAGEGLPTIVVFDEGYKNDAGTWTPFIADDRVIVFGRRPGNARIAEYLYTFNANNPQGQTGPYMKVVDNMERDVPRRIQVHDGHNGGPAIYFPGAIIRMSV